MKHAWRIGLAGAVLAGVACSAETTNNSNGNNQTPPTLPSGVPQLTVGVGVENDFFDPNSVLLATGGTVTWTWYGDNGHSVTPDGLPFSPTAPISVPPKTLSVTFQAQGDYRYFCTAHGVAGAYSAGSMIGTIYVR